MSFDTFQFGQAATDENDVTTGACQLFTESSPYSPCTPSHHCGKQNQVIAGKLFAMCSQCRWGKIANHENKHHMQNTNKK